MLFDITRTELVARFGEDRIATLPAAAFPPHAARTEGARLLRTVGVPTGTLSLRGPDPESGLLPLVREVADADEEAGGWPVIGWLLNAHLALDPDSGTVYAFDPDEETAQPLHTDASSLVHVTLRFQRLLEEFAFGGADADEEAGFERLEREVAHIRRTTSAVDPLPFGDEESVWSVVAEEIAAGQRFAAGSPGAASLYG
ncbi:SUKH-4 family immunity protein [Streptomyces drozdowiczii]|uniref:SUKH-4 family immunity protein n=1 Tax=Streptomyces drozdowiczii TaxID=202862 RepID=A0ABY6PLQ8_9ACTN|nr:SUKH-4 family immunity protein [Streptomyces drozdowiczii]MCX0247773.1 SUKH-4 family immunity protein [Streptomyces drozdowiczii]UZK52864.1 SUKH-4 family immunity protein [Streptomyces drozdowiczii]